ncbi:MAG: DUF1343 domain-containing protein [Schleiferiaceae bacterium]|nr:DUF1343 domain-containing protein [Schleiferiaceae bacterium]
MNTFKFCLKDTYKLVLGCLLFSVPVFAQDFQIGAAQYEAYQQILEGKKLGVIANQTSYVDSVHLVDFLIGNGVEVVKVFAPEHGFRGSEDAGAVVKDGVDAKTGLPLVSLYGKNKKPSTEMLRDIDVLLFDIQDVGVRFYTYISTMSYAMEAAAEHGIPFVVLDRPNPNGHYVDGPILKAVNTSFVGLHPVPIVHGLTIGEYAKMVNGEGWLKGGVTCELHVIPCANYRRDMEYILPIPPSPNLRSQNAIYLYPSLCLFEGTDVSVGRGTDTPFEVFGAPWFADTFAFSFVPKPNLGASNPMHSQKQCYGISLKGTTDFERPTAINLSFLYMAFEQYSGQKFFNNFFIKLIGDGDVQQAFLKGLDEKSLRELWKNDVEAFIALRKPYLIYR